MELIQEFYIQIINAIFHEKSLWELTAVALGLAYLLLAMRQNILCWVCAFFSTAIYIKLFWDFSLLMDSMLNIYYLLMAVYGFLAWSKMKFPAQNLYASTNKQAFESANKKQFLPNSDNSNPSNVTDLPISSWNIKTHVLVIAGIVLLSIMSGFLLDQNTEAAWPYLDSFTTWGSVITTYMVAKKILENWLYWLVIDSVAMALYFERGLYFTALLFGLYLVLVIIGYFSWKQDFKQQASKSTTQACNNHNPISA